MDKNDLIFYIILAVVLLFILLALWNKAHTQPQNFIYSPFDNVGSVQQGQTAGLINVAGHQINSTAFAFEDQLHANQFISQMPSILNSLGSDITILKDQLAQYQGQQIPQVLLNEFNAAVQSIDTQVSDLNHSLSIPYVVQYLTPEQRHQVHEYINKFNADLTDINHLIAPYTGGNKIQLVQIPVILKPSNPVNPVHPANPVQPVHPIQPVQPLNPITPVQPTNINCVNLHRQDGVICQGKKADTYGQNIQLCYTVGVNSSNPNGWIRSNGNMACNDEICKQAKTGCTGAPTCSDVGNTCDIQYFKTL